MKIVIALAALVALAPAAAGDRHPDPMGSPQCAAARVELDALLAQARASREQLQQARRHTAQACLGTSDAPRQRSGAAEPPQAVPPTIAAPRPPVPPVVAPPPPPLALPRPTAITTCDPGGCWDSDGRRLNQMGPLLVGPGGVCHGLGGIVSCP